MTADPDPPRDPDLPLIQDLRPVPDVPSAFAAAVADAFARRPGRRFALVLSGGPTARACYQRTAELPAGTVDWGLVDVYMGDERVVPPDDPDANQRLVREALVEPVGGVGGFHPMPTRGDPRRCALAYQEVVAGVLAGPGFDLVHLGMGPDGHTASLFPGAPTLDAGPGELVVATADPNGQNAHSRLSLTLPVLDQARLVVFTVAGEAKRDVVARLRAGDDLPAARVRAHHVRWLIDPVAFGTAGAPSMGMAGSPPPEEPGVGAPGGPDSTAKALV